jgi:hypothetical protein
MRFRSITFSVENTIPLDTLSGNEKHKYANIKPKASVTVEFDSLDNIEITKANLERARSIVVEAFDEAQKLAHQEIIDYRAEMKELFRKQAEANR